MFFVQLAHDREGVEAPVWQFASLTKVLQLETEHTPNPVIQRVKLVMSAGLMMVHALSRWPCVADENGDITLDSFKSASGMSNSDSVGSGDQSNGVFGPMTSRFLTSTGTEQILMIGLVCALAIKYIFFENKDIYNIDIARNNVTYSKYNLESRSMDDNNKRLMNKDDSSTDSCSNTTSTTPSSTRPTTPTTSTTSDELESSRASKPATPSILITQDSDTESVIAEYRRKISESQCNDCLQYPFPLK